MVIARTEFFITGCKAEQLEAQILGWQALASSAVCSGQTIAGIPDVQSMEGGTVAAPAEHIAGMEAHDRRLVQVPVSSLSQGRY